VVIERSSAASVSPPLAEPDVIVVEVDDARVRIAAGPPAASIAATLKALRPRPRSRATFECGSRPATQRISAACRRWRLSAITIEA